MKPATNDPLLRIRDLSVDYRTRRGVLHALRRVNMDVPRGGIVGLVGESGCGKSTLISAIVRLLPSNAEVSQGTVEFDGRDLLRLSEAEMRILRGRDISMIFQNPMETHNPVLSIGRQMIDIQYRDRITSAEKRRRAVAMLDRVGIPDPRTRMNSFAHELSGGMRQRIAIAMALMVEPKLLIADEPTTALDATLEVQIIHRLRELQESLHCAILFISHHLGVIAELCDHVVVMYAGEVVEEGSVRGIFHHARHPYTRKLLECDPGRIAGQSRNLPTIPGEIPDLIDLPQGCIFRNRCPAAFERCGNERPVWTGVADGHFSLCHLSESGG